MTSPGNELVIPFAARAGLAWPAIEPNNANSTGMVASGELLLAGFSFRETSGGFSAALDLFDGFNIGGQFLASVALTPGQTIRDRLPGPGVHCEAGLFMNLISGTVIGACWVVLL